MSHKHLCNITQEYVRWLIGEPRWNIRSTVVPVLTLFWYWANSFPQPRGQRPEIGAFHWCRLMRTGKSHTPQGHRAGCQAFSLPAWGAHLRVRRHAPSPYSASVLKGHFPRCFRYSFAGDRPMPLIKRPQLAKEMGEQREHKVFRKCKSVLTDTFVLEFLLRWHQSWYVQHYLWLEFGDFVFLSNAVIEFLIHIHHCDRFLCVRLGRHVHLLQIIMFTASTFRSITALSFKFSLCKWAPLEHFCNGLKRMWCYTLFKILYISVCVQKSPAEEHKLAVQLTTYCTHTTSLDLYIYVL